MARIRCGLRTGTDIFRYGRTHETGRFVWLWSPRCLGKSEPTLGRGATETIAVDRVDTMRYARKVEDTSLLVNLRTVLLSPFLGGDRAEACWVSGRPSDEPQQECQMVTVCKRTAWNGMPANQPSFLRKFRTQYADQWQTEVSTGLG